MPRLLMVLCAGLIWCAGAAPESPEARNALAAHAKAIADAEAARTAALKEADEQLAAALEEALDAAMERRDLDEANRINAELKKLRGAVADGADEAENANIELDQPAEDFFTPISRAPRVVFLVDGSGSMIGVRSMMAKQAIRNVLDRMPPRSAANVIVVGSAPKAVFDRPMPLTDANRREVDQYLDRIDFSAAADFADLGQLLVKQGPDALVILSDGDMRPDMRERFDTALRQVRSMHKTEVSFVILENRNQADIAQTETSAAKLKGRLLILTHNQATGGFFGDKD